ncbi:MAG: DedA family protein [Campylobacteraceae bacterium]|nr:DedA family protein [Campylobacteraceae bacterium]
MIYLTLFLSAFISATLFPLGSEALLVYNINEGYNLVYLLAFATVGNVLGSLLNYFIGLKGEEYLEKKAYLKEEKIKRYKEFFDKYGAYSLLLSWAPVIGDPLTLIAGVFKYDLKKFLFLVFLAKFLRYLFLAVATLYFVN